MTTQDEMKQAAAQATIPFIIPNTIIGIGTGSTANFFIDELAKIKETIIGTIASSEASANRLKSHNIPVLNLNEITEISVYVDGADESNHQLELIKGGGGALTREKIVAAVSQKFICVADESKLVKTMGQFPLPVEVIPMSANYVSRQITQTIGGNPILREGFTTDNGNVILDIHNLEITQAKALEDKLNAIVGVVTNGLFANRPADVLILGTQDGVKII